MTTAIDSTSDPKIDTRSRRPSPTLSSFGFLSLLIAACMLPLVVVTLYALFYQSGTDAELPVNVQVTKRLLPVQQGGQALADVVVFENQSETPIRNLTAGLKGMGTKFYYYHRTPIMPGEPVVVLQTMFKTKSNQPFDARQYPLEQLTVTGQLPSGARGVQIKHFEANDAEGDH